MDELLVTDDSQVIVVPAEQGYVEIEVFDTSEPEVLGGSVGIQGPPGQGVAVGGQTGDVLVKNSDGDYDTSWTPLGSLGGDKTFTQSFIGTDVTVTHGLGKFPAVTVLTSAGDEVEGEVEHVNLNQLNVHFTSSFSGTVICN